MFNILVRYSARRGTVLPGEVKDTSNFKSMYKLSNSGTIFRGMKGTPNLSIPKKQPHIEQRFYVPTMARDHDHR